jgi:RNA polymerase sigma-70 factor (ECF subfamily)
LSKSHLPKPQQRPPAPERSGIPAPATPAEEAWEEDSAVHYLDALIAAGARAKSEPAPSERRPMASLAASSLQPEASVGLELDALDELFAADATPLEPLVVAGEDVGALFAEYQRYVAAIGGRILGTGSEVDDLVQDVFLATYRDVHKLRDRSRLKAWLATITTRMATRRRARRALQKSQLSDPDGLVEMPCHAPSPEFQADAQGSVKRLLKLPPELRKAWLLRHVEGASLSDIAERCECSMSTAQRRIRLASLRILGSG